MYLKLSLLVAIAIGACLCTNVEFNDPACQCLREHKTRDILKIDRCQMNCNQSKDDIFRR
ncbi:hypothetical protein P5673_022769 [Acropora cervicornis]|uniref:Uncharacterized protein n=1 Tax=Acropora cervicornis TaxID=6130 RepID=A0AAD9Q663_ACRCE|nr:hypothetical protein P5673_022769 [Acropora cervicornis]